MDNSQVDFFTKYISQNTPGIVPIDIRDYNSIKNSSRILNSGHIELPIHVKANIDVFREAIKAFSNEKVHKLLLEICTVGNNLKEHGITIDEMDEILKVLDEHFGDIDDIVWGLSSRDDTERCGYDINVIVGYDL